ncbi:DDE_3 domain-containing protein [Trichonephila clavipes]|nr:DDE_3 domain-containing protein [Trichonephila clavipes]
MRRSKYPLPALQYPINRTLQQRKLDGLGRYHVRWPHTPPCLSNRHCDCCQVYAGVYLFRGAVGPGLLYMDDNVKPYRTHLAIEFLVSEDIRRMDWLAIFPDFKFIELA